jgi:hypothetical protein
VPTSTVAALASGAPERLRYARLWSALGIGFVLLVIYLSLTAKPPDVDIPDASNIGHVIAYFWLMIWFAQIHRSARRRWLLAAAFGVLGVVLEFVQGMTGYRHFDYLDMARNFAGIGIGLVLARSALQDTLYRFEDMLARAKLG